MNAGKAARPAGRRGSKGSGSEGRGGEAAVLAVDIGNTQTVVGVFEGKEVRDLFRLSTGLPRTGDDLWPVVERLVAPYWDALLASGRSVIGSVVPAQTPAWEGMAQRLLGRPAFVASPATARGLRIEIKDLSAVGVDRIANAVAVAALYRLPAVVVDLGTATTFDVVLPGPRYVGGVIAPGVLTSAEELFRRAARLPKVEIRRPASVLGRSTDESVQSGVFFGAVAQIDGLVRRLGAELKLRPFVIATGGIAGAIAGDSETIERVDPALTLHGLRILEERGAH
jgi:type III pantothenate kinase